MMGLVNAYESFAKITCLLIVNYVRYLIQSARIDSQGHFQTSKWIYIHPNRNILSHFRDREITLVYQYLYTKESLKGLVY